MKRILPWLASLATLAAIADLASAAEPAAKPGEVDFARDVAPILERHCIRCHQTGSPKGDLSLATAAGLLDAGHVVPGKPEESGLLDLVRPEAAGKRPAMPKEGKPLSAAEVDLLAHWIEGGAVWPKEVVVKEASKADKSWWSLRKLADPAPPSPAKLPAGWEKSPIDRFVFAKLQEKNLLPNPPAEPRALLRRLCFDLTGLPPTPEQMEAFAADASEAAYEKLVDDLLASTAYGERWGRHWLDVTRFGESNGFERNVIIDDAWPFRDYVIQSFNADKPFDRLVREHLAGDLLGPGDPSVEIGTGFLVAGPYDNVGNQDAVQAARIRADTLDDMVRAVGESFLGVTIGCARCHNHKFDPVLQQDYHRVAAALAGTVHGMRMVSAPDVRKAWEAERAPKQARRAAAAAELSRIRKSGVSEEEHLMPGLTDEVARIDRELAAPGPFPSWWIGQFRAAPGPFHLFIGGDPQKKGDAVAFAPPSFLSEIHPAPELPPETSEADRRRALAEWIVAPENALTPRVLANRVWQHHFGTGIVDTPSDFGYMGGRPTHPELLDWLARRIQADGWRLKPLHKLLVTSQTYKQSSAFREDAARIDGDARLLWRRAPRRLSGEEVRDAMLQTAGKLDRRMGGPGFRLYRYVQDNVATYHPLDAPGPETYRRAVYHQNARAARVDVLTDFDCPDPASAAPRRASTTTPLQALTLFNHRFTFDMAEALAARASAEAGPDLAARVQRVYLLAYGRNPTDDERTEASALVETRSLRAFCRAVLNSNEFLYVD